MIFIRTSAVARCLFTCTATLSGDTSNKRIIRNVAYKGPGEETLSFGHATRGDNGNNNNNNVVISPLSASGLIPILVRRRVVMYGYAHYVDTIRARTGPALIARGTSLRDGRRLVVVVGRSPIVSAPTCALPNTE